MTQEKTPSTPTDAAACVAQSEKAQKEGWFNLGDDKWQAGETAVACGAAIVGGYFLWSWIWSFIKTILATLAIGGAIFAGGALLNYLTGGKLSDLIPEGIKTKIEGIVRGILPTAVADAAINMFSGSKPRDKVRVLDNQVVEGQAAFALDKDGNPKYAAVGEKPSYPGQKPLFTDESGKAYYTQGVSKSAIPAFWGQEPVGQDQAGHPIFEIPRQPDIKDRSWAGWAYDVGAGFYNSFSYGQPQFEGQKPVKIDDNGNLCYAALGRYKSYDNQVAAYVDDKGQLWYTQNVVLSSTAAFEGQEPIITVDGKALYEVPEGWPTAKPFGCVGTGLVGKVYEKVYEKVYKWRTGEELRKAKLDQKKIGETAKKTAEEAADKYGVSVAQKVPRKEALAKATKELEDAKDLLKDAKKELKDAKKAWKEGAKGRTWSQWLKGSGDVKAGRELVKETSAKVVEKKAAKAAVKGGVKAILKKTPIGVVFGSVFAAQRAWQGDWTGAGLEFASGACGTGGWFTFGGSTTLSIGIDATLATRDVVGKESFGF